MSFNSKTHTKIGLLVFNCPKLGSPADISPEADILIETLFWLHFRARKCIAYNKKLQRDTNFGIVMVFLEFDIGKCDILTEWFLCAIGKCLPILLVLPKIPFVLLMGLLYDLIYSRKASFPIDNTTKIYNYIFAYRAASNCCCRRI